MAISANSKTAPNSLADVMAEALGGSEMPRPSGSRKGDNSITDRSPLQADGADGADSADGADGIEAAGSTDSTHMHDRLRRISEAAYGKAEQRGFHPGAELDDWLQAERDIDGQT